MLLWFHQWDFIWTVEGQQGYLVCIYFTTSGYWNNNSVIWKLKSFIHMPKGTQSIWLIHGMCRSGWFWQPNWRIFHSQKLFQKWYKKIFLGILHIILVNGCILWIMSAWINRIIREKGNNSDWKVCIAKLTLNWTDLIFEAINSPSIHLSGNLMLQHWFPICLPIKSNV